MSKLNVPLSHLTTFLIDLRTWWLTSVSASWHRRMPTSFSSWILHSSFPRNLSDAWTTQKLLCTWKKIASPRKTDPFTNLERYTILFLAYNLAMGNYCRFVVRIFLKCPSAKWRIKSTSPLCSAVSLLGSKLFTWNVALKIANLLNQYDQFFLFIYFGFGFGFFFSHLN